MTPDTFDHLVGDVEEIMGHTVSFHQVYQLAQLFVPLLNVPANSNQKETKNDD